MGRLQIGPVVLLVPEGAGRSVTVKDFSGLEREAWETPAVVAGPQGLLLEITYRRWDERGMVVLLSRGDSSPSYDRLLHGERLGIKAREDGTDFVEADLLRWSPEENWGGSTMATPDELDATLGSSVEALLVQAGCLGFGTRAEVLADASKRRNRQCGVFPATEPLGPLALYVLTRVLPIQHAGATA